MLFFCFVCVFDWFGWENANTNTTFTFPNSYIYTGIYGFVF